MNHEFHSVNESILLFWALAFVIILCFCLACVYTTACWGVPYTEERSVRKTLPSTYNFRI